MPFETEVTQLDSAAMEELFKAAPEGTVTANNLKGGKQNGEETTTANKDNLEGIPFLEDEPIEEGKTPEQIAAEKVEAEKLKKDDKKTPEQLAAEKAEAEKKEGEDDTKGEVPPEQVNSILKNTVDYLIKNGHWEDFDGREDLEITEEVYADLVAQQDEARLTSMFSDLVDSTGAYGKAILSHIKSGGNPDEIIDIFKEQRQVQQIDTSTDAGKQALIEKYYGEILGWKPEKVQKTVKRLITDDEIGVEFTDVKEAYDKHYQQRLEETNKVVEQQKIEDKKRQTTFVNNIKSALDSDTTFTPQERKQLASSILDFKHQLDNGQKVNDFYVKFAEMQADPKAYIKLVRFVMDPARYEKKIEAEKETKVAKNTFNFIKGNAAVAAAKANKVEIDEKAGSGKQYKGTDFSFALNR